MRREKTNLIKWLMQWIGFLLHFRIDKRVASRYILAIALLFGGGVLNAADSCPTNQTLIDANGRTSDGWTDYINDSISSSSDVDYFKIVLTTRTEIQIYVNNKTMRGKKTNLEILSSDCSSVVASESGRDYTLTKTLDAGTYYAKVSYNNGTTNYKIRAKFPDVSDLEVSKSVDHNSVNINDAVTFTLVAKNNGPDRSNIKISDTIPNGFNINSVSTNDSWLSCSTSGQTVNCTEDDFYEDETATITINTTATTAGRYTNTATIESTNERSEPTPSNNSSSVNVTINGGADLNITEDINSSSITVGDSVLFTVYAQNLGPDDTTIKVTDTIPDGFTITSVSDNRANFDCSINGQVVSCTGSRAFISSDSVSKYVRIKIFTTATQAGTYTNTASVESTQGKSDPNLSNNSFNDTVTVQGNGSADLNITEDINSSSIKVDDSVLFTVYAQNLGPDDTTIKVTDTIPDGFTITSVSDNRANFDCSINGRVVSCTGSRAFISSDSVSKYVRIKIFTTATQAGRYTNTASVESTQGRSDPDLSNNSLSDSVIIEGDNQAPTADAGADQTADQGDRVTLDGSGSSDPDGDTLTYEWKDEHGNVLSNEVSFSKDDFTVGEHTITLTVTDPGGLSDSDSVKVTINGDVDAKDNYYSTDNDTNLTGNVILDSPADVGQNLEIYSHTDPESGTLTLNDDGSFNYEPNSSVEGNVSFDYTIKSQRYPYHKDTATVFIEVKRPSGKPKFQNDYTCGLFTNVLVSYDSITSGGNGDRACGTMFLSYPNGQMQGDVTCFAAPNCTGTTDLCKQQDPPKNIYIHDVVDTNVTGDNNPLNPTELTDVYYGNLKYTKNNGKKTIHFNPQDTYDDNPTKVLVAGDLYVNGGYTLSFEPGDYYFRSITIDGNNNAIILPNGGPVRIFVKKNYDVKMNNLALNTDSEDSSAGNLFIYVGGDVNDLSNGGGTANMKAFFYVKGSVTLNNNSNNWEIHGGITAEGPIVINGNNPDFIQDSDANKFGLGKCKMCYADIKIGGMSFNMMGCGGFSMFKDIQVPIYSDEEVTDATVDEVHNSTMFSFSFMQTNEVIDQDGNHVADATTTSSGWNNGAMGMDVSLFGGKAITYPIGNPYGPANPNKGYNQLHNSSMFDMSFDPCKWGQSLVYVAHYNDKEGRHYDVQLEKCPKPEVGFCEAYGLDEGFHMIDPDGGDDSNMFEIYCDTKSDLAKKYGARDLIALPMKRGKDKSGHETVNKTNNFVYDSDARDTVNYYQEAKDHGLDFDAIEINANKMEVVVRPEEGANPVDSGGYKTMGTDFSNINLIGTPFAIDWSDVQLEGCDPSTLRKAYHGQAVKVNLLKDKDHTRCTIRRMRLKLLDDYKYVEYKNQEVLERTCKEFSEQVPIDVMASEDIKGHYWITPHQTTRDTDKEDITKAYERPIVAYCWYQTDLDWAWTFLLALDGKVTNSKNDVMNQQDTCSQLGLYFFVPNSKETFDRVRRYLKEMKSGDLGWENYTGTIREKYKTYRNNPNQEYYLNKIGYEQIWPYGPMGIYNPCGGNKDNTNGCAYRDWRNADDNDAERGWMSGSPMHNIKTEDNYDDSMGAKGWVSILGKNDLNVTDDWWVADIGAGEEVGIDNPDNYTYSPHGTHKYQSPGFKYYEPNGNYTANAWLNFVQDSEGWVYHLDDNNAFYAYYDYMCMADTNYIRTTRSYSPAGLFNIVRPKAADQILIDGSDPEPQDKASVNALYTQLSGVDYNITAVALRKDPTTDKLTALNNYKGLVGVELIQTPSYRDDDDMDERQQKCESAIALTLPTNVMLFNDNAKSTTITENFDNAHTNLSYRVKYFKNPAYPDEAIRWDCADDTYGCIWETLSTKIYDPSKCNDAVGYPANDCPCSQYCKPALGHESDTASDICKQCIFQNPDISGSACSRDSFAVRPVKYIVTPDTNKPIPAGSNSSVNYKLQAVDINDNNVSGYKYARDIIEKHLLKIDNNISKAGCDVSKTDINGTLYFYSGNSRSTKTDGEPEYALGVKFNDVGEINITVSDENWTQVDIEDNDCVVGDDNNTRNSEGKFGCNVSGTSGAVFVPGGFKIDAKLIPNNNNGFTYIANDIDKVSSTLELNVTAMNSDGNKVMKNYSSACYAKDMNITTEYLFNGNDYNASNPANISLMRYDVLNENNDTIKSLNEIDLSNATNLINIQDLNNSIFSTDHNGTGVVKVRINFDRKISTPVNPFVLNITDINVSNADDINGTLSSNLKGEYYYARVASSKDFYDNITTDSATTPIYIKVYYTPGTPFDNNSTFDTSLFEPTAEFEWFISTAHNDATDGKVQLITTDSTKGTVTSNPVMTGGENKSVTVTAVDTTRPLIVDVNLSGTDSWLIYNQDKNEEPAPFYRVRFIGADDSNWTGYGKTGHVIDVNVNKHRTRRLEW